MSDEFMNNVSGEQGNTNEATQTYSQPEQQNTYYSGQSTQPNYGQANYSQPNYNQNGYTTPSYGQSYQQPGMAQKSSSTGFGIASLVLGILSIFTFFCCFNYILAIIAIILGIVQLVKSSKKGCAIGGIVTACISIIGASIFWVLASNAAASSYQNDSLSNEYFEEYMQEYMQGNDPF